jgi:hypothetical protein
MKREKSKIQHRKKCIMYGKGNTRIAKTTTTTSVDGSACSRFKDFPFSFVA